MKYLILFIVLLQWGCESDDNCGCIKTTYEIETTFNPVTIKHVEQRREITYCQDEVGRTQIGTGNFWYKIECK